MSSKDGITCEEINSQSVGKVLINVSKYIKLVIEALWLLRFLTKYG